MSYFVVPKGIHDVRMVYDETASGLNERLWLPGFPLPTAETHLRALEPDYFMADVDIGEMFLNFVLHESLQAMAGVDLISVFQDELRKEKVLWELRNGFEELTVSCSASSADCRGSDQWQQGR